MKTRYQDYTAEDFVLDREFRKWVLTPDQESNLFWENWLDQNHEKSPIVNKAIKILKRLPVEQHSLTDDEIQGIATNIENALDLEPDTPQNTKVLPLNPYSIVGKQLSKRKKKRHTQAFKWAAILAIVVGVGYAIRFVITPLSETLPVEVAEEIVRETKSGQRLSVMLEDGSRVILNSSSSISFVRPFGPKQRAIKLTGEAYFEVAEDHSRPFSVETNHLSTTALGTTFNIKSIPEEDWTKVSLVEGKVAVQQLSQSNSDHAYLEPGERVIYYPSDGSIKKSTFSLEEEIAWKDGIIVFKNSDLTQVIQTLERWYGVEVQSLNKSPKPWNVTANFDNQSLENVLISLGYTMGFTFEIENKSVTITYKK